MAKYQIQCTCGQMEDMSTTVARYRYELDALRNIIEKHNAINEDVDELDYQRIPKQYRTTVRSYLEEHRRCRIEIWIDRRRPIDWK